MIIPIDDKFRIRGTDECWQVEQIRTRKGQSEWRPFKYYRSLGDAVREAGRREIRLHPAETLVEAFQAVDAVAARYSQMIDDALAAVEIRAQSMKIAS